MRKRGQNPHVKSIKVISVLYAIGLKIVDGIVPDYMHACGPSGVKKIARSHDIISFW